MSYNNRQDAILRLQQLALDLITIPSFTPDDAGCSKYISDKLATLGFNIKDYSRGDTTNTWAEYGSGKCHVVFAGHTDVVPSGDLKDWSNDPFKPSVIAGEIIGRGAVDMKGALAAMLYACERFFAAKPDLASDVSFSWALTSDEEGDGRDGVPALLDALAAEGKALEYVLVGEPSCDVVIGDTLRMARRGSLTGLLAVRGKQGHVAYAHKARNAISSSAPLLNDLVALRWDDSIAGVFPATNLQCVNLNSGLGASNVIPGELSLEFNLRYAPNTAVAQIKQPIIDLIESHLGDNYTLTWRHSAKPYITTDNSYIDICKQCVAAVTGVVADADGAGGTSDARHFAAYGAQVVELGLSNATAHKINEKVSVGDLLILSDIYYEYLSSMLCKGGYVASKK